MKSISLLTSASTLAAIALFAPSVSADIVITVAETPNGVSIEGDGTLDLGGLSIVFEGFQTTGIVPSLPVVALGPTGKFFNPIDSYGLTTGSIPSNIGPGSIPFFPTNVSGDVFGFGLFGGNEEIFVPDGYVSGDPLAGTSFYASQSFASIGLTPGSYGFTIPSGDSVTVNINAIPEPTTAAMLGLSSFVLISRRRRRISEATFCQK